MASYLDGVKIWESPISGVIYIVMGRDWIEAIRVASNHLADPAYKDRDLILSGDLARTTIALNAKDRNPNLTATDLWTMVCQARYPAGGPDHVPSLCHFEENITEQNGSIKASLKQDKFTKQNVSIYEIAIDAALLSRQHDGKPVEFTFRGKTLNVSGATRPEDIEKIFPENQRTQEQKPPRPPAKPFTGYGYPK